MLAPNMEPASSAAEIGAAAENTTRTTAVPLRTRFDDDAIRRWVQTDEALKGWMQAERSAPTVPVNGHGLSTGTPSVPPPDLGVVRYPSPARELPREPAPEQRKTVLAAMNSPLSNEAAFTILLQVRPRPQPAPHPFQSKIVRWQLQLGFRAHPSTGTRSTTPPPQRTLRCWR